MFHAHTHTNTLKDQIIRYEIYKFIEKPWDGESLKIQIKRAIEHYGLLKERIGLLEKIKIQNDELKKWNEKL